MVAEAPKGVTQALEQSAQLLGRPTNQVQQEEWAPLAVVGGATAQWAAYPRTALASSVEAKLVLLQGSEALAWEA